MTRVLPVMLALFSAVSVQAMDLSWLTQYKKPNMHYGQLALHPFYRLTEIYDSNIYLVPRDRPNGAAVGGGVRGSWITSNNLGLEAVLPWRRLHTLSAGYDADFQNYTTQPKVNDTINQRAHLDYAYAGAYGLTFKAGDEYENTTDQAFSELVERNRRWVNDAYTSLDYNPEGSRLAGGIDANHTVNKYVGADFGRLLNRYEQKVGFNAGYMVQPKTKAYVSYHRGLIHYTVHRVLPDQDKDNKSHSVGLGVTGVITSKIEGRIEGGATYREYDEAPIGGATRVMRTFTIATDLTYKPDDRTLVQLKLSRFPEESISAANRFFISNNASLDIKHKFPRKFSAGVNVAFGLDKYPDTQTTGTTTDNRRDDIYQGGAWLEYDIQEWLSTGISYVYRERNSTFTGQYNYQDHQTAWNAALKF